MFSTQAPHAGVLVRDHDPSPARRYWDIVRMLAVRSLKVRYRGSALGVYWSLSNPLIMTAIYSAIFGTAFAKYYGNSVVNYVLACFTGLVVLNFFSQTSSQALTSIVSNGALLNKMRLPVSAFPLSLVLANLFQYAVGVVPLLVAVTLYVSHSPLHCVYLIVPSIALLMVTVGFSLGMAALFVFFRDLPYLYELVVFALWITSPIFYPIDLVPAGVRHWVTLNPIADIIELVRTIVFTQGPPTGAAMFNALTVSAVTLVAGVLIFRLTENDFMDLI
jgi:ABC-2 type transport system permease protein/lipopolysaccharide transport system permease protein